MNPSSVDRSAAHSRVWLSMLTTLVTLGWVGWTFGLLFDLFGPEDDAALPSWVWLHLGIHFCAASYFGFDAWCFGVRKDPHEGVSRRNLGPAGVTTMLAQHVGFGTLGILFLIPYFISIRKPNKAGEPLGPGTPAMILATLGLGLFCLWVGSQTKHG